VPSPSLRLYLSALGVAIATVAGSAVGHAQSANASISATVLQPITITKNNDLLFGNVFPGVNSTVAVTGSAAQFTLAGTASANVNLSFTLPTNLTSGANNLPIGTWTGYHNATASPSSGGTAFTPSASATASAFSGSGALSVYVGGTVQPAANQTAGTYTGTLTLNAAYF
jgi:hypothetical protein